MGTTSKRGLRYPDATTLANTLHTRIKELADDTELNLDYVSMGGVQKVENLAGFSESGNNVSGYLVVQTNFTYLNIMQQLFIRGWNYIAPNNIIDLSIVMYPFSTSSSIANLDVVNKGSMNFKSIGIYTRNSDAKIAIALELDVPSGLMQYPKLWVDGMFAHTLQPPSSYQTGWSITRQADLSAYTLSRAVTKGLLATGYDSGWVNATYLNSWATYGGSYAPAGYRRQGSLVQVRGLVAGGVIGTATPIFNLPVGFRPNYGRLFPGIANIITSGAASTGTAHTHTMNEFATRITVDVAGNVSVSYGGVSNGYVSLESIWYSID